MPRISVGCGGAGEGVESLLQEARSWQRVPSPGPCPSQWRRAAFRDAGVPEFSSSVTPAR